MDLDRYKELKTDGAVSLELVVEPVLNDEDVEVSQVSKEIRLVFKKFDPATGKELETVDEVPVSKERVNQQIDEYKAKIASLEELLTDLNTL